MRSEYRSLDAVHSDDLERLLRQVGLIDSFTAGKAKCKFCGNPVTHETIYSVLKDSGTPKLVCSRADCVNQLMLFVTSRKKRVS